MIQFFKKRSFGDFISDTFTFFKENGGNYFKNYLLINGLLVLLLSVVFFIGYQDFFMMIFSGNTDGQGYYFERLYAENEGSFIFTGVILAILYLILVVANYLYPIFFLKRKAQGQEKISVDHILSDMKANAGKALKFLVGFLFVVIPIVAISVGIASLLIFLIIGIFLLFFIIPVIINFISFLSFDYFSANRGFFNSLSYALRSQFSYENGSEGSPFWKYWGGTVIMYMIIAVISYIFTLIPMMLMYGYIFTVPQSGSFESTDMNNQMGIFAFVMALVYALSIVVGFMLSNFLYVCIGLMYYDSRTDLHKRLDLQEIDSIGVNEI